MLRSLQTMLKILKKLLELNICLVNYWLRAHDIIYLNVFYNSVKQQSNNFFKNHVCLFRFLRFDWGKGTCGASLRITKKKILIEPYELFQISLPKPAKLVNVFEMHHHCMKVNKSNWTNSVFFFKTI